MLSQFHDWVVADQIRTVAGQIRTVATHIWTLAATCARTVASAVIVAVDRVGPAAVLIRQTCPICHDAAVYAIAAYDARRFNVAFEHRRPACGWALMWEGMEEQTHGVR